MAGDFDRRLSEASAKTTAKAGSDRPSQAAAPHRGGGAAARVGIELVSALVVGLVIGYWLDRWLHTKPVFLLLFLAIGAVAGLMNVWREVLPRRRPPAEPD